MSTDSNPVQTMGRLISGYWMSQAVYVAAKLELADRLAGGGRPTADLAAELAVHPEALFRLLRALAGLDVFRETADGKFENTPASETLRRSAVDSQWPMAVMMGEEHYRAWGELLFSIRTGEGAFRHVFGEPIFEFLQSRPEQARVFDAAMTSIHGRETAAMLDAYDFAGIHTLCDVGGGNGTLLIQTLQRHPSLHGLLYDLPHVAERAQANIIAAGLTGRCRVQGGDFFAEIPGGADAYLLRHIIHDWDDPRAAAILRNIVQGLPADGRVLIVESVIPPGNEPAFAKWLDLTMLVIPEGKERTETEYRELLAAADLELVRIVPTAHEISVLEARRR